MAVRATTTWRRAGADILRGGPGDDLYVVDSSDVVVETLTRARVAGYGQDTTSWSAEIGIEAIEAAGSGDIDLTGNELNNVLLGNDGSNVLSGGEGVDILVGGGGDDTLDGGSGRDRMVGGLGDDVYYVDAGTDQVSRVRRGRRPGVCVGGLRPDRGR